MTPTCYAHDTQNSVIPTFFTDPSVRPYGSGR